MPLVNDPVLISRAVRYALIEDYLTEGGTLKKQGIAPDIISYSRSLKIERM